MAQRLAWAQWGLTRNHQRWHFAGNQVHECIAADLDDPRWMQQVRGGYRILVNCESSAGGGLAGTRSLIWTDKRSH